MILPFAFLMFHSAGQSSPPRGDFPGTLDGHRPGHKLKYNGTQKTTIFFQKAQGPAKSNIFGIIHYFWTAISTIIGVYGASGPLTSADKRKFMLNLLII
jgi:hypothetical protein